MNKKTTTVTKCPLCGEEVSWKDKKVAEYACLYTCVRLIPYPEHILSKHREYLEEAGRVAKPIFYSASTLTLVFILSTIMFGLLSIAIVLGSASAALWITGAYFRKKLLSKFKVT